MKRDVRPPWVIFADKGADIAILPAGRPGQVMNVEGVPRSVVTEVVRSVNEGRMSVEDAFGVVDFHKQKLGEQKG